MFPRLVALLLLLSLPTDSYALRQAGVESEPTRQELSGVLSAGAEETPAGAPLNLKVRTVIGHDYDQIMEISGLNSAASPKWNRSLLQGYAQMDQVLIAQDQDRFWNGTDLRLAGFLAFEVRGGRDGVMQGPERVEIVRLEVQPDYQAPERVAQELLELLGARYPGRRVRVRVDQRDVRLRSIFEKLGFQAPSFLRALQDRDVLELRFPGSPGQEAIRMGTDLNVEVEEISLRLSKGEENAQEAALEMMRILDRVVAEEVPFSNWAGAHRLLDQVEQEADLGSAVSLRVYLGHAARRLPAKDALKRQMELFRGAFDGQSPFQYLEKRWVEDLRVAGLWRELDQGEFPSRAASVELLEILESLQATDSSFTNWGDAYKILSRARQDWMQNGSSPRMVRDLDRLLRQLWRHRTEAAQERDSREEWFTFLERYQRIHRGWIPSRVLARDWPADEPQAGMESGATLTVDEVERAVGIMRKWINRVQVRISVPAVFVVFVPAAGHPGREDFLDDWKLIEEAKERRGDFANIEIRWVELQAREDVVGRALKTAAELATSGLTVGFALGVLPQEEIQRLRAAWSESGAAADPRLTQSFLVIPREQLDKARGRGFEKMPSLTAMYLEWVRHPGRGVRIVTPPVLLPRELWREFEQRPITQAGVEAAA